MVNYRTPKNDMYSMTMPMCNVLDVVSQKRMYVFH